jgi:hypothetical protein
MSSHEDHEEKLRPRFIQAKGATERSSMSERVGRMMMKEARKVTRMRKARMCEL